MDCRPDGSAGKSSGPVKLRPGLEVPEALLLQRAGTKRKITLESEPRENGAGERVGRMSRYGARAFSTLEGYASRNCETELAFPQS